MKTPIRNQIENGIAYAGLILGVLIVLAALADGLYQLAH